MTTYLRARNLTLELPQELQGENDGGAGSLGTTLKGTTYLYSTVLSRISFEAGDGDRIGILGLNGAGKTTLLRALNGGLPPTAGTVERKGTLQSLLNPMLGFNESASLTENILLRGTAMGLRYRQLQPKLDEILAFAGLQDRASHRLKILSAGQRMRLGFAISTAVQPDILIMDEWISAGDAAFIERAQERMRNRFHGSRIVVLATHSIGMLRAMCNKTLVLDKGRMRFFGAVEEGIADYRGVVANASAAMRKQLVESDPLLFGDPLGFVERVSHTADGLSIEGWVTDDSGDEVQALCVEVEGHRHLFDNFEKIDRDDVRRHLGKRRGRFGFKVQLDPKMSSREGLGRLKVSAGSSRGSIGAPLPFTRAAALDAAIEDGKV
jgi:ABC-type polysaccharide/polyol phosphate transport system ATPase subunit